MKALQSLALLVILTASVCAKTIVVVTVDKNGKGTVKPTKITAKEFALLEGYPDEPPEGTRAVILKDGEKAKWSDASDEELERKYKEKKPKKKIIDLDEIPEKEPIPLFDEEDTNISYDIKPLDGVWKSVFDSTKLSGCSAMMQSMLKKFTPPTTKMTLKFSKPFNPNKDLMNRQFKWKKIKANKWKGTMYKSGAIPQGMSMNGEMLLTVKSKKKMGIFLEQTIVLPKEIAQLTGSTTRCKVVTKGHYIKIK